MSCSVCFSARVVVVEWEGWVVCVVWAGWAVWAGGGLVGMGMLMGRVGINTEPWCSRDRLIPSSVHTALQ